MGYSIALFDNRNFNSTQITKDQIMKTTSALFELAADLVLVSLQNSKGVKHIGLDDAIFEAARQGKFRKEVLGKALQVVKYVSYDAGGRPADFGKTYTESRDPYAYDSIERNALKRADALLLAAEIAKAPIRTEAFMPVKSVGKVVEQLDTTQKRLVKAQNKIALTKGITKATKAIKPLTSADQSLARSSQI
jgi:hypothetical protein